MTENKRYFKKEYEEFYILDSEVISEEEFEEKLDYQGYKAFEDSLTSDEIIDLLNENERLKSELVDSKKAHSKCDELYWELEKENEQLKHRILEAEGMEFQKLNGEIELLRKENKELKQDNDIKFWKLQFMNTWNETQMIMHELSLAMNEGYEVSDKFKEYIDNLKETNEKNVEKAERLGI